MAGHTGASPHVMQWQVPGTDSGQGWAIPGKGLAVLLVYDEDSVWPVSLEFFSGSF